MKKFLSAVLAGTMLLTASPMALAADDLTNHWAKQYITYLSELEVMKPSSDGSYKPAQTVTRAEFMRYLNRAFNFTEKAQISFSDVPKLDSTGAQGWYYEPIQIAVAHGYITGVGNNKMDPFGSITREQAATIIGRLHKVVPESNTSSITFKDKAQISSWSAGYIAEAVEAGYIVGYTDGTFKPKNTITRAEFAKILYNYMGTSMEKKGVNYTAANLRSDVKNATISAGSTLSNVEIKGDLYITEGTLSEAVTLSNVQVDGKIIVSGGAVTLDGVTAPKLVVSTPLSRSIDIVATGKTNIGKTEVQTSCSLGEQSLDVSAGGFSDVTITGDKKPTVALDGSLWSLTTSGASSVTTTSSSTINALTANAVTAVMGTGSIHKATLNVSGCSLAMQPANLSLASGVTATIAGENTASSNSVVITPNSASFDIGNTNALNTYTDYTMSADPKNVTKLTNGTTTLTDGTDYRLTDKGFRLYKSYIASLKEGNYAIVVNFEDGARGTLPVTITNSAKNFVDITSATFDKYHSSANYANLTATLQLAKGAIFNNIKLAGTTLERGTDYTYNGTTGAVILQRTTLEKRSTGVYTVTFEVSAGNNPTLSLTIEDSSPKNEVKPTSVDFDANTSSGGYQDVTVTLNRVDGATLSKITCGDKTLQENWQYKVSGNQIVLSKTALSDLAPSKSTGYVDLVFDMSTGTDPVLRVNYVTTYAIKTTVVDDLGKALEGVEVTIAPSGSSTDGATPAQTLTTNSEGIATAYVKRGSYTLTAKHSRFAETLTRSISVSGSQSVSFTAAIMETVNIYVTDQNGANLADAAVALGGKSVTTGTDGLASFQIKRGDYTARVSCSGYNTVSEALSVNQTITQRIKLTKS